MRDLHRIGQGDFDPFLRLPAIGYWDGEHSLCIIGIAIGYRLGFPAGAGNPRAAHHQRPDGKAVRIAAFIQRFLSRGGRGIRALERVGPRAQHRGLLRLAGAVFQRKRLRNGQLRRLRVQRRLNQHRVQSIPRFDQRLGGRWQLHGGRKNPAQPQRRHHHSHQSAGRQSDSHGAPLHPFLLQIKDPTLLSSTITRCVTPRIKRPPTRPPTISVSARARATSSILTDSSCASDRPVTALNRPHACV